MAQYDDDLMHVLRDVLDDEADLLHIASGARTALALRLADAAATQVDKEGQRRRRPVYDAVGNKFCSHCFGTGCNRSGERPTPPEPRAFGRACTCTEPTPYLPARETEPAGSPS
jgi:hypothetical protein